MAVKSDNFLFSAKVHHKRVEPKQNQFNYRSYFIAMDMSSKSLNTRLLSINKTNLFSLKDKDHGCRDNQDCREWANELLVEQNIIFDNLVLITMPRVFGYLFNPVSFWLAYREKKLVAIIAEVNNTFGETHSYICHKNNSEISGDDWFVADKIFHVSPFFDRDGYYKFNFKINLKEQARNYIIINYFSDDDKLRLATSIAATVKRLSSFELLKQSVRCPLLTLKIFGLIHYQAFKLFSKKIRYRPKPEQKAIKVSLAKSIKNI